jgi:hypothetical protein
MTKSKKQQAPAKERGTWLSIWLIFIMLHGILASVLIWYLRSLGGDSSPAWVVATLFVMAIVDVVAAILVWNWKRWGLWLYAISTVVGIVIGLVLTRSQLWVFHDIIPLVILGFLVKDKQSYFDKPPLGMG